LKSKKEGRIFRCISVKKKYSKKARKQAYSRRYPEKKDKKYFWLQLLLPLGLWLIDLCLIFWLFTWYH